jgi:hypothetical protein
VSGPQGATASLSRNFRIALSAFQMAKFAWLHRSKNPPYGKIGFRIAKNACKLLIYNNLLVYLI